MTLEQLTFADLKAMKDYLRGISSTDDLYNKIYVVEKEMRRRIQNLCK